MTLHKHALAFLAALVCSVAAHAQEANSRLDQILARGKLIVGVSSEAPPFGFVDDKGELVGFDIDIARLVAEAFFKDKTKVEFVKTSTSARFPNVDTGKVDFGIQATTIYPERALRLSFTRPYMDSGIAVLMKKTANVTKLAQLNSDKLTAANLTNPQQQERHKRFFPKAKESTFDSYSAQFLALKTGRADFLQVDLPVAQWYAKGNPEMKILPELLTDKTQNAIFMKSGDFRFWLAMDTIVAQMRGGSMYSEYADVFEKWFGNRPKRIEP